MSNMTELNVTNGTTTPCTVFDTKPYVIVALVSAGSATLSLLACIAVLFLSILLKKYLFFVQRLIMYLCIAALLNSAAIVLRFQQAKDLEPTQPEDDALRGLCVATAFFDQTTAWAETIAICCITMNLLLTAVFKKNTERLGILYFCLIFILPITFNWIPFLEGAYGEAGAWCWIRSMNDDCEPIPLGVYLRFIIWYVPNYIIIIAVILVYAFIIIWVTRQRHRWVGKFDPETEREKKKLQKEVWPLMFYPLGFLILNIFPLVNRIHDTIYQDQPVYALWILHAIFSPLQGGYIALVYAFNKDTRQNLSFDRIKAALCHREAKIQEYIVDEGSCTDSYYESVRPDGATGRQGSHRDIGSIEKK